MRYTVSEIAPAVDKVLGEQFKNMLLPFDPVTTEAPNVDSFNLDIETIEEAVTDEASDVRTAKLDEADAANTTPQAESN
jgi:hypothetical protein